MTRLQFLLRLGAACGLAGLAQLCAAQPAPARLSANVACGEYGRRVVTADLYLPPRPGVFPGILFIHGGGWSGASIESSRPVAAQLAARGYVVAVIRYRVSGEAKYPAALFDCKAAIRFLRTSAARFEIDPARIGVMGGSAGGHLAALLAVTNGLPAFEGPGGCPAASSAVGACVAMAANMDLYAAYLGHDSDHTTRFFGGTCSQLPEVYRSASPASHIRKGLPPILFIEGEKDDLKIGRAEMQHALTAAGVFTDLVTFKNAPHPFWTLQPWIGETADVADRFFRAHL